MKISTMKKTLAAFLAAATVMCSVGVTGIQPAFTSNYTLTASAASTASVTVTASAGYAEGAYAEWQAVTDASGYNVYADGTQIDGMLIRQYASCFRADALGLKAGSHTLKIVPVISGKEDTSKAAEVKVTTTAHDRSGFGFVNGTSSGAYNDDGTLKSNATVIYVTNATKDTVKVTLPDKKGNNVELTGVQNIITGLKSNTKVGPVCIRFIGNVTDPATLTKGDLYVDTATCGLTIEGVGKDATLNGYGLVMKNSSNVEVRNLGFMNCNSDEGDDCGLQQGNNHIWVHNCDFFYGDAGSDADQVKGDGSLDTKTSTYVTHSYNHFWDNGKCNLQGMKSESTENYITYHHNWYDHSDSRHPRIRTCSVHIYNNYFDGNAKYGVGVTLGASAFVENNYFRNCKYPMLISMQGSDIASGAGTFSSENGGIIKAFNNTITGDLTKSYVTYQQNSTEFDAYEVKTAGETVPASVTTKQGGTSYNNFDTSSVMYKYTAQSPEEAVKTVTANAGRVQGGDFKWTFNNATDDASYTVDEKLKAALVAYKDSIVAIGSGFTASTDPSATEAPTQAPTETPTQAPTQTPSEDPQPGTPVSASAYVHNFTENGTASTFYTISGNLSTSKGSVTYDGKTLTQCLKLETATSISFTAPAAGKLTLVFVEDAATIKLDGKKLTAAGGIITADVAAGAHTLTKADSANLFYMVYSTEGGTVVTPSETPTQAPTENPTQAPTNTPSDPSLPSGNAEYVQIIYASPNGTGSGMTEADPTNVTDAISKVPAGGIIYLLGGKYAFSDTITIAQDNSGAAGKYKTIAPYKGAGVVFDFSGQTVSTSARGIVLDGSYWHFYGFEVYNAGDNGMLLSGNNNIIEMMTFNDNEDTGLQISRYRTDAADIASWPTNNLIKNCTSKNNCDEETKENADGFAAKLTCGEGNVFDGCISYNNSDDGWDLYAKEATGPIGVVTIKNCIAFRNGFTEDGRGYGDADGNGFKLGGGGVGTRHQVENCLAFENLNCGFTDNNNPEFGDIKNCTAYNNDLSGGGKLNYSIYRNSPTTTGKGLLSYYNVDKVSKTNAPGIKVGNDKLVGNIENSIYYNGGKYYFLKDVTAMTNGAKLGDIVTVADSDFITLEVGAMGTDFNKIWRNADGSPNPQGFVETPANGTYATIGYHMSTGITQTATPAVNLNAAGGQDPVEPSETPTETPSETPTETPTQTPSETPTQTPSETPTETPTQDVPGETPTETPSDKPTETPSEQPSVNPDAATKYGDVNEDGEIDIMDVIALNKYLLGSMKLGETAKANADVDTNKSVDSTDSLNILKYVVELVTELPIK